MAVKLHMGAFHYLLWQRREANGTLRVNTIEYGKEFECTRETIGRLLKAMVDDKRITLQDGGVPHAQRRYIIGDPADFDADDG